MHWRLICLVYCNFLSFLVWLNTLSWTFHYYPVCIFIYFFQSGGEGSTEALSPDSSGWFLCPRSGILAKLLTNVFHFKLRGVCTSLRLRLVEIPLIALCWNWRRLYAQGTTYIHTYIHNSFIKGLTNATWTIDIKSQHIAEIKLDTM